MEKRIKVKNFWWNQAIQIFVLYLSVFGCWMCIFLTTEDTKIVVLLTLWLGLILIIAEWYRRIGSKVGLTLDTWKDYCKFREKEMSAENAVVRDSVCRQLGEVQLSRLGEDLWGITTPYLDSHNDHIEFYIVKEGDGRFTARVIVSQLLQELQSLGVPQEAIEFVPHLYGVTLSEGFLFTHPRANEEFPRLINLLMTLLTYNSWILLKQKESERGGGLIDAFRKGQT